MEDVQSGSCSHPNVLFERGFLRHNATIECTRAAEFSRLNDNIFLDHAGTTLYSEKQLSAVHEDLCRNLYGNPHSGNTSSTLSADTVEQVRYRILQHFNTSAEEYSVVFTSGCTAALKLVAESFQLLTHGDGSGDGWGQHGANTSCSKNEFGNGDHRRKSVQDVAVCEGVDSSEICNGRRAVAPNAGQFWYLEDNHTSVLGMRELFHKRGGLSRCVESETVQQILASKTSLHNVAEDDVNKLRPGPNCLFAYPAQSNFNGFKYPLEWVTKVKELGLSSCSSSWYTLLDAAGLVSTSPLDLSEYKPDFVTLSFYKMFGYPTGLGALLVRNTSAAVLQKTYFGGGTVQVSMAMECYHVNKIGVSDCFEDGTLPFLDIIALRHGFDTLHRVAGDMAAISKQTFQLSKYVYTSLASCYHGNGAPVAKLYCDSGFDDSRAQGPVVNFNLLRPNGDYIGFAEVDKLAQAYNIHVRTGCFCNMGACQRHLGLTSDQVKENFKAGHVCGDSIDLLNGRPTGSVRVSFGYTSTLSDAQALLRFVEDCFVEGRPATCFIVRDVSLVGTSSDPRADYAEDKVPTATAASDCTPSGGPAPARPKYLVASAETREESLALWQCPPERVAGCHGDAAPSSQSEYTTGDDVTKAGTHGGLSMERPHAYLRNLFIYPVKSCGAFEATQWQIGPRGLLYDRQWMIVTEVGVCVTQKREPRLCQLRPHIDVKRGVMTLTFPGMEAVEVPLAHSAGGGINMIKADMCQSKVCGDRVSGEDCGNTVAEWLQRALGRPGLRLVHQGDHDNRVSKKQAKETVSSTKEKLSLANEAQYLLINHSSVEHLHAQVVARQQEDRQGPTKDGQLCVQDLTSRFRSNLVVGGVEVFEEDTWSHLSIGSATFQSVGPCTRCQMICVDQSSGERSKEPLRSLMSLRDRKSTFGVLFHHVSGTTQEHSCTMTVGDLITPTVTKQPEAASM